MERKLKYLDCFITENTAPAKGGANSFSSFLKMMEASGQSEWIVAQRVPTSHMWQLKGKETDVMELADLMDEYPNFKPFSYDIIKIGTKVKSYFAIDIEGKATYGILSDKSHVEIGEFNLLKKETRNILNNINNRLAKPILRELAETSIEEMYLFGEIKKAIGENPMVPSSNYKSGQLKDGKLVYSWQNINRDELADKIKNIEFPPAVKTNIVRQISTVSGETLLTFKHKTLS